MDIRTIDGVGYTRKLPIWVKVKYFEAVNHKCQLCNKEMDFHDMHVHRKTRGHKGGLYTICPINHKLQNCMLIHSKCHKLLHSGEPIRK